MPPRNVYTIFIAAMVGFLCHAKAEKFRDSAAIGDAMNLIDRFYVDRVDKQELLTSAMAGLTSKLDPYTQYIPPGALESFQDSIQQEFAGIGILIEQPAEDSGTRVITPLVGSPALDAGFQPGDWIIQVAGENTEKASMSEVSKLLRGPIGTEVQVRVRRNKQSQNTDQPQLAGDSGSAEEQVSAEGQVSEAGPAEEEVAEETGLAVEEKLGEKGTVELDLVVRRANIQLDSVAGDYRNTEDKWVFRMADAPNVAYVRLTGFGERTTVELRQVLMELNNQCDGLVLDLRGNAGGLLTSAVDICDMFLDEGMIVSTRGRGILDEGADLNTVAEESAWRATPGVLMDRDIPMTVLVDRDSASAAEIVAACLKDHGRASVVGERSFGKGSVQNVFPLEHGRSALKLTTARYYRPNGHNIHRKQGDDEDDEWGVSPSDGLAVPVDDAARLKIYRRLEMATYPSYASTLPQADLTTATLEEVDPQLFRAVEVIRDAAGDQSRKNDSSEPSKQALSEPAAA